MVSFRSFVFYSGREVLARRLPLTSHHSEPDLLVIPRPIAIQRIKIAEWFWND